MKKHAFASAVLQELLGSQVPSAVGIPQQHQPPYMETPMHSPVALTLYSCLVWCIITLLSAAQALTQKSPSR